MTDQAVNISIGCMLVSLENPHRILMCNDGVLQLLTYSQEEVVGRSIRMLCGPESNAAIIWKALKDVSQNIQSQIHLMLYDRRGQYQSLCATFSPYLDSADEKYGCLLKLEHSDAVSMDQAL